MKKLIQLAALLLTLSACNSNEDEFDASGSFEADEVIVSAQANGQLLNLSFEEGDSLYKGQVAGFIDATQLELQKQQVEASISALDEKTATAEPTVKLLQQQISVQRSQLQKLLHERERIRRLVAADAATGKQLDDINAEIEVLQKQISVTGQQINVQRTNIAT